jgi:hypothetical protein
MKRRAALAFLLLIVFSVTAVNAGDRMAFGVRAGTLGLGVEFDYKLTDRFAARLAANSFDYDDTVEDSGIEFDGTLELQSVGAMIDFYPFKGGFHATGGLFLNNNGLEAVGIPEAGQTFEIGNNTYDTADIGDLTTSMEFKDFVPYLGLGWGNPFSGGKVSFAIDLGIYKQGNPDITLSTTDVVAGLEDDLALEVAEMEEELEEFDFWPVLQIGVTFRF